MQLQDIRVSCIAYPAQIPNHFHKIKVQLHAPEYEPVVYETKEFAPFEMIPRRIEDFYETVIAALKIRGEAKLAMWLKQNWKFIDAVQSAETYVSNCLNQSLPIETRNLAKKMLTEHNARWEKEIDTRVHNLYNFPLFEVVNSGDPNGTR